MGLGEVLWDDLPGGRRLGGAPANFAYHTAALGADARIVSAVGPDDDGRALIEELRHKGLDTRFITTADGYSTGMVQVELSGQGLPVYSILTPAAWDVIPMTSRIEELAGRADAVCFGSLAQRLPVSRETIRTFLSATRTDCLRLFDVNLRQRYFDTQTLRDSLELADILKLNYEELPVVAAIAGFEYDPRAVGSGALANDATEAWGSGTGNGDGVALVAIGRQFGLHTVALTRGARGCLLLSNGELVDHPGVKPDRIVDTVGAGDCFAATLVTGLLRGDSLQTIADEATRRAAYVCEHAGAMPDMTRLSGTRRQRSQT